MKKVVYTILLTTLVFLSNIVLYFYSDAYSFFLKKMKYWEEGVPDYSSRITDEYLLKNFPLWNKDCSCENIISQTNTPEIETFEDILPQPQINEEDIPSPTSQKPQETEFEKQQKELRKQENIQKISQILPKFSKYNLVEKPYDEYYQIFDISDEYPNSYFTYSSPDLEIYFFPESNFSEFYNIFSLLANDSMVKDFELNQVNTFWKKTFFINLIPKDEKVRLVVDNGNILFWLKMKKGYYNDIKNILLQNF